MELLKKQGAEVSYYDPHVPVIRPTPAHAHLAGIQSVPWNEATVASFDAVIISTAHQAVNYHEFAAWAPCMIDKRNVMASVATKPGQVAKA